MFSHANEISQFINNHRIEMVDKLRELVNLEGHFNEKHNVEKVRDWVQEEFETEGFKCSIREVAPDKAGMLVGVLGSGRPGKSVLFSGHIDTVHYTGSFGTEHPFNSDGEKAYGPGVLDMKGGIIIALYVVKALNHIGFDASPIKILFVCEEESDHVGNDADKMITDESVGVGCAFNMECGELENRLSTARKSQHTFFMTVQGVGGHAGNDFWRGKNAIHEAIYKTSEIIRLTDMEKGTTVTTSIIKGGSHASAIADLCEAVFDVRVCGQAERDRIYQSMDAIMNKTFIDGTTTTYTSYAAKLAPLAETEDVLAFWNYVNDAAEACGQHCFGKIYRGGATDAGNIAAAGVPVLCSCGIRGDFAHNLMEYGIIDSMYDRATIFALAVANIDDFYNQEKNSR